MQRAALAFLLILSLTVAAQEQEPHDTRQTGDRPTTAQRPWQFFVRGNGQLHENFFQAVEGANEESVTALFAEVGASVGFANSLRAYGSVNYLHYNESELDSSPGVRLGLRMDGEPHAFNVYAEQLMDRPTFDVGDEFDRADIRTVAAEYSYRLMENWQLGVDGELQDQENDITSSRDNEFGAIGASVRWRGSRKFSPEVGIRVGERDVDNEALSYDQRDAYVQIRSALTPKLYLSGRFRDRKRDYGNSGREDKRRQLTLAADYTLVPNLILNLYAGREKTNTNVPGRDFTTGLWQAGLTWRF